MKIRGDGFSGIAATTRAGVVLMTSAKSNVGARSNATSLNLKRIVPAVHSIAGPGRDKPCCIGLTIRASSKAGAAPEIETPD